MAKGCSGQFLLRGCATMFVLGLIAGGYVFYVWKFDRMSDPSLETVTQVYGPVAAEASAIRVDLAMATGQIEVKASADDQVHVDGQYDSANYQWVQSWDPHKNRLTLKLKSGHSRLSHWLAGGFADKQNRMTLQLPAGQTYELTAQLAFTRAEFNLNGLGIHSLDIQGESVDGSIVLTETNPVEMEKLILVLHNAGEPSFLLLNDLDAFRLKKGWFNSRQGARFECSAKAPLGQPTTLDVRMDVGGFTMYVAKGQRVIDQLGLSVGSSQTNSAFFSDDPNQPALTLKGHIGAGDLYLGPVSRALYRQLRHNGWSLSQEDFMAKLFEATDPQKEDRLTASQINSLGYTYLYSGRPELALAIFEHNVATYPDYVNGYDSYAEGLMVNGNREKAIEYYKITLEKDPGNRNALRQLRNLGAPQEQKP
ncbi:MAG: tetratricopeptide repeat protein [Acidobacteria bacterium]|nr:tetratricopeptide repeat protein [Acidobacteriota bacterium]MCB9397863.1 tetratricopeptide repeat protein [Acidobacteriota bacterium]